MEQFSFNLPSTERSSSVPNVSVAATKCTNRLLQYNHGHRFPVLMLNKKNNCHVVMKSKNGVFALPQVLKKIESSQAVDLLQAISKRTGLRV